jgi:hypothetical protein
MKALLEHLNKCGSDIFLPKELNEPIMIVYKILKWALESGSDTLVVHANFIAWRKNDVELNRWEPQALIPTLGYQLVLEKIIHRDQVVRSLLKDTQDNNGEEKIYKISTM